MKYQWYVFSNNNDNAEMLRQMRLLYCRSNSLQKNYLFQDSSFMYNVYRKILGVYGRSSLSVSELFATSRLKVIF